MRSHLLIVILWLGLSYVPNGWGQEQGHLPAVVQQALDQDFPGAVIQGLRTKEDHGASSYELELVDAENRKPFDVVLDGKGQVVQESEHVLHVDRVPSSLLALCDLLKKDRATWKVERQRNGQRVYRYWSGEKPGLLQMYGVHYGDILARAGSDGAFSGEFKVAEDTGMARGLFAIERKPDGSHQVTIALKERRGGGFSFLDDLAGKRTALQPASSTK
jgi:hypothetical protein